VSNTAATLILVAFMFVMAIYFVFVPPPGFEENLLHRFSIPFLLVAGALTLFENLRMRAHMSKLVGALRGMMGRAGVPPTPEIKREAVDILVEELLTVWRAINKDPNYVTTQRKKYGLLADLPAELEPEILPYFAESAKSGAFPANGGGVEAVKTDFEFYAIAGQLQGDPAKLKVEDFWYLGPLDKALDKLGRV